VKQCPVKRNGYECTRPKHSGDAHDYPISAYNADYPAIAADPRAMPNGLIAFYAEFESKDGFIYLTQPIAAKSISEAALGAEQWGVMQPQKYIVRAVFQHGYGEVDS
jgi:hypothetical protein